MIGFQITVICSLCTRRYAFFAERANTAASVGRKVRCRHCNGELFEYFPVTGFIYILSNPDMPGLVKIGHTTNPVEERVRQLSTTGVPSPFVIEAYFASPSPLNHEQQVHQRLSQFRRDGREFFQVDVEKAYATVRHILSTLPVYVNADLTRRLERNVNHQQSVDPTTDSDLLNQINILSD